MSPRYAEGGTDNCSAVGGCVTHILTTVQTSCVTAKLKIRQNANLELTHP